MIQIQGGLCSASGGAPTTFGTFFEVQTVPANTWTSVSVGDTKMLPPGTYTIGFCSFQGTAGTFTQVIVEGYVEITR